MAVMSKKRQAEVWLKAEQALGFLLDCDLEGALTDPNLFGEVEQMHSQAMAEAQAELTCQETAQEIFEEIEKFKVMLQPREHYLSFIVSEKDWQTLMERWCKGKESDE